MKKKTILLVVLLLAVGFAAVTTTLFINGTTNIGTNKDDFEVYYSKALVNGVEDNSVITDDTHIVFTQEMKSVGETYVLDYDVTNGSRNYDAELSMSCTESNEYLNVTNVFDDNTTLPATETRTGKLTIELIKGYVGETAKEVSIECTINATALERNTLSNGTPANKVFIPVTAVDSTGNNLNATSKEIVGTTKDILLEKLVESGIVSSASVVDALIEVESDDFNSIATTTFDVSKIANNGDTVVILHFDETTQEWEYIAEETVVDGKVTGNFTSYSPVAFVVKKEDGTYEAIKGYSVGDTVTIGTEGFHVISNNGDTVTLFADYNLGTDYRQSTTTNYVKFSDTNGWEYTPGPKEINIQSYDGNAKTYVNNYVDYLKTQVSARETDTLTGNLITVTELIELGCKMNADYSYPSDTSERTCNNSANKSWIVNGQNYWTRSASTGSIYYVWYVYTSGGLGNGDYYNNRGVRPVITISKSLLS